jgi:L-alanine-DL-glutamate epimerase-like enolase superfamily enzyme
MAHVSLRGKTAVERLTARAFRLPTEAVESDGTATWEATTMIVVEAAAAGCWGIGWSYGSAAAATVIDDLLADAVCGTDAMDVAACHRSMSTVLRNPGLPGIGAIALSAVDCALWDLKARILDVPLVSLLGGVRDSVSAYGSGGFTSLSETGLARQLGGWAADGHTAVKMKVGRNPGRDPQRARVAREAIGPNVELFVDANGAYERSQALGMAERFAELGVSWFEEPVSSDDVAGLRLIRDRSPAGMRVAAGEYGWTLFDLQRLLEAGAVDVLQADATRCGGVTGFMRADALCQAHAMPLSAHTAPGLHVHLACAAQSAINVEYFSDHARMESLLFDGVFAPAGGRLHPDRSRPGLGVELREADAEPYRIT